MNLIIKNLDCWNFWIFLKTCCFTQQMIGLTKASNIIILNQGIPYQELSECNNYILMDLFYKIFEDFHVVVDPEYKIQTSDRLVDEIPEIKMRMPNNEEYYSETLARCLSFIRKKLTKNIDVRTDLSQDPKILYISRSTNLITDFTKNHRHWIKRVIKNNQEVKRTLREHYNGKVLEVDKQNLPNVIDQLKIVNQADILLGIHGAGLNWIIAAKDNAVLYEFFPQRMFQFNGMNLARNLGLKYYAKHIDDKNNIFNVPQIFEGLDITIKLWRSQAPSADCGEISERVDNELADIARKGVGSPIRIVIRKLSDVLRRVVGFFLRLLKNWQ